VGVALQQTKRGLFDSRTHVGTDATRQVMLEVTLALDANAQQNPARADTVTRMSAVTPDSAAF
jgi:hypothetical protein